MAVYSKEDYEKYLHRKKNKKKKILKSLYISASVIATVALLTNGVLLLFKNTKQHLFDDNYTEAINFAIEKFATEVPSSYDNYPRLNYDFLSPPPTPSDTTVVDDYIIHKEYGDENSDTENKKEEDAEENIQEDNQENNTDIENADKENEKDEENEDTKEDEEKIPLKEKPKTFFEYNYFVTKAGKGNYPGYGINGEDFIQQIRMELCLAIKAYTTMPVAQGTTQNTYRIDYSDSTYDYIYFFLSGEVKKVEKDYLKKLDNKATNKNVYDVNHFWISLTEDKSSYLAEQFLSSKLDNICTVVVTDKDNERLENAKVSMIAGSYITSFTTSANSVVVFRGVPEGSAEIRVERNGYIDFPHEAAYKEYDTVKISKSTSYIGDGLSHPYKVKMVQSSAVKCSFAYNTINYELGKSGHTTTQEHIRGNFNITLTNRETNQEIQRIIKYDDEFFYWCDFFEETPAGQYDMELLPTDLRYRPLKLTNLYINEHGISHDGYLSENSDYVFSFNTDENVNVAIKVTDNTTFGLNSPKGKLAMYHLIQTGVVKKEGWAELKLVNCKTDEVKIITLEQNEDGLLVGNVDMPQNAEYDVYLSTIYGDISLARKINLRTNNYCFNANITDDKLPKTIAEIYIQKAGNYKVQLVNTIANSKPINLSKEDVNSDIYVYKTDEPIPSGLHYLNILNENGELVEVYLTLVSSKSNNYTISFE